MEKLATIKSVKAKRQGLWQKSLRNAKLTSESMVKPETV